jgi:DNA mismatch endonuclease, patch repair protein
MIMRSVRRTDTTPEILVRKLLHGLGLRFSLHRKNLPGTPDIVLPKHRTVVFVHGCFWHRHKDCSKATTPRSRATFWSDKFESNMRRDRRNSTALKRFGWRVVTVWECETKRPKILEARFKRLFENS